MKVDEKGATNVRLSGAKPVQARKSDAPPARQVNGASRDAAGNKVDKVTLSSASSTDPMVLAREILETHIGKQVSDAFEKYGIDMNDAVGLDFSPDATAKRIFDFSTGLLGIWQEQHPEMSEEEVLDSFESTIRGAVDRGYGEAMEILEGMGLGETARPTAEETMTKLHSLYDDFFANARADLDARKAEAAQKETDRKAS